MSKPGVSARAWIVCATLLVFCACLGVARAQHAVFSGDAVKAAFLYRFASYVEWPAHAPAGPLVIAVAGADSEALLMHLDLAGIAASSGSACSTGAVEPSHVLVAMGMPHKLALGAIRFSLGRESTHEDIERAVEIVPMVVAKVRKLAGVLGRADSRTAGRADSQQVGSGTP